MLVSIIIPVYNVAPYIKDCLQSVMRQSYAGAMECLLVDDCGTDESMSIAENMIAEYNGLIHFEILHHEHNRGLSAARNTGTEKSVGDYIYFIDSDDEITEDCIEKMMAVVEKYPQVEMVQGRNMLHKDGQATLEPPNIVITHACSNDEVRSCFYTYEQVNMSAWNKLMKRSLIVDNNLFFIEGLLYEDTPWLFYCLKYIMDAYFLLDATYHYKIRSNSIVMATSSERTVIHRLMGYHHMIQHISPDYAQQETEYYIMSFASFLVNRGDGFPGLKDDYRYFRHYACEKRKIKWVFALDLLWFLGNFRYGRVVYSLIIKLKHPSLVFKEFTHFCTRLSTK